MKKQIIFSAALLALTACGNKQTDRNYVVTAELSDSDNGQYAYIIDYDTSDKIDSVVVENGRVVFNGKIDKPVLARLIVNGARRGSFILEADSITVGGPEVKGGELNGRLNQYYGELDAIVEEFRALADSLQEAQMGDFEKRSEELNEKYLAANGDNPVGYYVFLQQAYEMDADQLEAALKANPELGKSVRIQKLRDALIKRAETSEGKMFKDFDVVYNDTTYRLSDYVGKGKYTLVDFWASWCGPCIRETATIKDIYNEYGPKGLDVLGVAVWDEPENTLEAIKVHELPWKQIINAQTVPTDIYGISGIPCIILFGPDGTIVSRNKQGDELREAVARAMAK